MHHARGIPYTHCCVIVVAEQPQTWSYVGWVDSDRTAESAVFGDVYWFHFSDSSSSDPRLRQVETRRNTQITRRPGALSNLKFR
jgi:hypothetical protein